MPSVWLVSDTHFGHEKTCTVFKRADGSPLRPFNSAEEMDEFMIAAWNERVKPNDKVYHLGDVVISRKNLSTLARLNGDKVLIRGNHDIFKLEDYTPYFRDIRSCHVMNGMILTHIPIHEQQLGRFRKNIHGHLHSNRVLKNNSIDPRYHCVCVEQTDFAPILFEKVLKKISEEEIAFGYIEERESILGPD